MPLRDQMFPSCLGDPGSDVALLLESLGIYILDCLGDDVAFLLERLVILDGIGERSARLLESLCMHILDSLGDEGAHLLRSLGMRVLDGLGDDVTLLRESLVVLDGLGDEVVRLLESLGIFILEVLGIQQVDHAGAEGGHAGADPRGAWSHLVS